MANFDGTGIGFGGIDTSTLIGKELPAEMVQVEVADWPDTVTTSAGLPAVTPAGTGAVIEVPVTTVVDALVPLSVTNVEPATKLVPAIVMLPPTVPVQPVTVGAGELAETLSAPVAATPATVTAITCAPVATLGTVTTIVVAVGVPITGALIFAMATVAPGANPVPVIVINELIAADAGKPVITGVAAVICNVEFAVEPPIFTTTE